MSRLVAQLERDGSGLMDLALQSLPLLSGGDLEDVMRALGRSCETQPESLLRGGAAAGLTGDQVAAIVSMLPLESVDQPSERLRIVRQRIAALQSIDEEHLRQLRDVSIAGLLKYEAELEKDVSPR